MTADVIREAKKSPFIPFDLVLVDGTTYTIRHPDYIWVAPFPRAREVVVSAADDTAPDGYRTRTINLGLVMEVVVPSVSVEASSNGPDSNGT